MLQNLMGPDQQRTIIRGQICIDGFRYAFNHNDLSYADDSVDRKIPDAIITQRQAVSPDFLGDLVLFYLALFRPEYAGLSTETEARDAKEIDFIPARVGLKVDA